MGFVRERNGAPKQSMARAAHTSADTFTSGWDSCHPLPYRWRTK